MRDKLMDRIEAVSDEMASLRAERDQLRTRVKELEVEQEDSVSKAYLNQVLLGVDAIRAENRRLREALEEMWMPGTSAAITACDIAAAIRRREEKE